MPNNRKPHSLHNVFSQQSPAETGQRLRRSVWQDKTARARNRAGSAKPEPRGNGVQSRAPSNTRERSQNHGSTKRRTVHLVLWVKPIVKAELQRVAAQEGLSMSKAAGTLLERALANTIDTNYNALLTPVIEQAIKKELHSYNKQIALLLARTLFASEQTRSLSTNILGRQPGVNQDILQNILAMTQRAAKGNITRTTPQLTELTEAIEQWLNGIGDEEARN